MCARFCSIHLTHKKLQRERGAQTPSHPPKAISVPELRPGLFSLGPCTSQTFPEFPQISKSCHLMCPGLENGKGGGARKGALP